MAVEISVILTPEMAAQLGQRRPQTDAARTLTQTAKRLKISLTPVHPHTDDPALATFFRATAATTERGSQIVQTLSALSGVEGAYLKPSDELP